MISGINGDYRNRRSIRYARDVNDSVLAQVINGLLMGGSNNNKTDKIYVVFCKLDGIAVIPFDITVGNGSFF